MPALADVPGVARVVFQGTFGTTPSANIFHVHHGALGAGTPWSSADLTSMVNDVTSAFVAQFLGLIANNWHLTNVEGTDLTSNTGAQVNVPASNSGANGTRFLGANSATCISWKTSLRYRGGHCRTYLAPPDVGSLASAEQFSAGFLTAANASAAAFLSAVNGFTVGGLALQLVLVRRVVAGVPLPSPLVVPINAGVVNGRIDSQRRRLGK